MCPAGPSARGTPCLSRDGSRSESGDGDGRDAIEGRHVDPRRAPHTGSTGTLQTMSDSLSGEPWMRTHRDGDAKIPRPGPEAPRLLKYAPAPAAVPDLTEMKGAMLPGVPSTRRPAGVV